MSLTWQDCSEITAGLVMKGKISPNAVRPEIFLSPYSNLVKLIKEGNIEKEDLIEQIGLTPIHACLQAVESLNGTGNANWVEILEHSAASYAAGIEMEKLGKKLQRGDKIDWTKITTLSRNAQDKLTSNLVPLSEVESKELPFIPSGWKILDDHLGGIPEVGVIVLGGVTGVGKTTFMTRFAGSFAKAHPNKKVVVFSIEMILTEIAARFRQVESWGEAEKRIILDEVPVSPDEAISIAATVDNLGLVCIDFSDLMVEKDTTESEMAHIYRTLMKGAKALHCPILLLSQLTYRDKMGGIPKPSWIRYSSMAESLAWMILMLYDPAHGWCDENEDANNTLPIIEDTAYIICWKCRGGFRIHLDDSPGAICVPFKRNTGWGATKSRWFSLKKEV